MGLRVAIAGASGLVGSHLLRRLLEDATYSSVCSVGRKMLPLTHEKLRQTVVNFKLLDAAILGRLDVMFCCLGTTMKDAGSQSRFWEVDHGYALRFAEAGLAAGARHFLLVSSAGAYVGSSNFYMRTKGELERDLKPLGYDAVSVFRPGVLLGDRESVRERERVTLAVLPVVSWMMLGPLRKFRPISAASVAGAMTHRGKRPEPGSHLFHFDEIKRMCAQV